MNIKEGIFISDQARDSLNIKLSPEEFKSLKEIVNEKYNPDDIKKCFITGQMVCLKDGLFLDPEWMAKGMEKQLEVQDKLWSQFKNDGIIICNKCGNKVEYLKCNHQVCPHCKAEINTKQYAKNIKLPMSKKITFKLMIKYLRKQAK